jgi:hypothetical protein
MTISEIKRYNFIRLCRDHGIAETDGAKLGALLKTSKQHGNQLLKGTSGLGESTIKKLCAQWKIREIEFIKIPESQTCGDRCPVNCDPDLRELCKKVKKIIDYGDPYGRALEANILCFEDSINTRRELENLKKTTSQNPSPGTAGEPARCTGRKQKAGSSM